MPETNIPENLDIQILHFLNAYYQNHPGEPEVGIDELIQELSDVEPDSIQKELLNLKKNGWVDYQLSKSGRVGLVWIDPKGIKVAQQHVEQKTTTQEESIVGEAFVPGYKYDIFVSYVPEDNQQHWVDTAIDNLKKLLEVNFSHCKSSPIWVEHTECTPKAMHDLQQSATVLIFLSKNYVNSPWCQQDDENFLKAIQENINKNLRVFLIEIDNAQQPEEFGNFAGYEFWVVGPEKQFLRTLDITGFPGTENDKQRYLKQLWQLCNDLDEQLHLLIKRSETPDDLKYKGVLINNHDIDLGLAHSVLKKLQRFGIGHIYPSLKIEKLSSENRNEFENTAVGCDGLLFIYGNAPGSWIMREVNRMCKIFVNHNKSLPNAYAIYDGPPEINPLPELFVFPGIVLDCRKCQQLEQGCQHCDGEKKFLHFVELLKVATYNE